MFLQRLTNFISMNKKFIHAITWNASAIFSYKIMLLCHQIILYSVIPKSLYGLQNTVFALIYTLIAFSNFGLDETILALFTQSIQSKQTWHNITKQIAHNILTTIIITIIFYITISYAPGEFFNNIRFYCNQNIIISICSIFCIENIKKTVLVLMQAVFLHKKSAYTQIFFLTCYLANVWTTYLIYNQITAFTIFIPMLAASLLELIYYTNTIIQYYHGLSLEKQTSAIPFQEIIKQRLYNYINQVTKAIYSPNSITLYFAQMLNFQQTATIKLYINSITLTYTCIGKTIGVSTGPFLANTNEKDLNLLFTYINHHYFTILYLITTTIICITSYAWIASYITFAALIQLLFFFTIHLLENLSITYEQLYISQNKSWILTTINCITLCIALCSYILLLYLPSLSLFFKSNEYLYIYVSSALYILVKITSLTLLHQAALSSFFSK